MEGNCSQIARPARHDARKLAPRCSRRSVAIARIRRRRAGQEGKILPNKVFCRKLTGFSHLPNQENQMVVIRLARGGAKKRPFYNIVAADSRNRRDGRFIERVGYYNPVASGAEKSLVVNTERLAYWEQNGAQLSPTVARLVKQAAKAA